MLQLLWSATTGDSTQQEQQAFMLGCMAVTSSHKQPVALGGAAAPKAYALIAIKL
jgi:hypothetical protein